MSPLELGIILHYHSHGNDMPWVLKSDAPIKDEIMERLVLELMLKYNCDEKPLYTPLPRLHAFVDMLGDTPLPVNRWIDPRTLKQA